MILYAKLLGVLVLFGFIGALIMLGLTALIGYFAGKYK
jgi:hypothetical protein